ncbi:MAG TPA: anthranilate synthase component I [Longimicrobiales bacterium]|nr:anthranilate synthase component I [Longimicrobiales bacterium]
MLAPDFDTFVALSRQGDLVPVWRELLFDTDTAVTAYAKLARPPFGFLLESVVGGEKWARWSFLGTSPRGAWRLDPGGRVRRWTPGGGWDEGVVREGPLADLDRELRSLRPVTVPGLPRFPGGAVGYLGYDVVRYVERLPDAPPDPLGLPAALMVVPDVVLAIDNLFRRARAIAQVDVRGAEGDRAELRRRYEEAGGKLADVVTTLRDGHAPGPLELTPGGGEPAFESSFTRAGFEEGVRRIKEYILAGDAFQVVLSQRLRVPLRAAPLDLYRALRSLNPSPYLFYLELEDLRLVGSSPEVLVRTEEGRVIVRPIAGTRPRGGTDEEDERLSIELLADEKERAEHLMLVDLGRNDVGRVARFGSVRVSDYMSIERYSHVLHMVSQVEGELREGLSAMDVFRACFPAGTVSGAPKVRAMEILDELEPVRRGPYAGAVGHFAYGGASMDTAIAIRTLFTHGDSAYVQAGAGIVADSDPAREYEETLAKARALLRVLGMVPS